VGDLVLVDEQQWLTWLHGLLTAEPPVVTVQLIDLEIRVVLPL
jgi:hypothetical protein